MDMGTKSFHAMMRLAEATSAADGVSMVSILYFTLHVHAGAQTVNVFLSVLVRENDFDLWELICSRKVSYNFF